MLNKSEAPARSPQPISSQQMLKIIVAVGLIGSLVFLFAGKKIASYFQAEVFELTYQFLLIGVLGGAIAWFYKRLEAERDEINRLQERERDMQRERLIELREIQSEILNSYTIAKKVRNTIRAKTQVKNAVNNDGGYSISKEAYESAMEKLIDAKTVFDIFERRCSNPLWFRTPSELSSVLGKMTEYIGDLVNEYEEKYSAHPNQNAISFTELPKLYEFCGPYGKANKFKTDFKYSIRQVMDQLACEQSFTPL